MNFGKNLTPKMEWKQLPLNGLVLFVWPFYEIPVVRINGDPLWCYKFAFELGCCSTAHFVTLYPFFRTMGMFTKDNPNLMPANDFGIMLGFYIDR